MRVLAIIAALLLEQWRPLADRKAYTAAFGGWAQWFEQTFDAGEFRHGAIAWTLAVLPVCVLAAVIHYMLLSASPLLAMLFHVLVLYMTLGFRQFSHFFTGVQSALREGRLDRARELLGEWRGESVQSDSTEQVVRLTIEEALLASHRHVFGVLLWYLLLPGPSGALLYRLGCFLAQRWRTRGHFGVFAVKAVRWLEWPAVRLTAASFAVVGDFEDAVYCWRSQAADWPEPEAGIVLAAGAGAIGVRLGSSIGKYGEFEARPDLGTGEAAAESFLDSTVGLLWRALVLWIFAVVLLGVASALG